MTKLSLLHVVTDYPDNTEYNNTKAVENLLERSNDLGHTIIALRRVKKLTVKYTKQHGFYSYLVMSLPFGMFHFILSFLHSFYLYRKIKKDQLNVDILHGHKLTIDGIYVYFLSKFIKKPYVLSVRADTDLKFINKKPFSRWIYKRIFRDAKHVFWVSAWAQKTIREKMGTNERNGSLLPNIIASSHKTLTSNGKVKKSNKFIFVGRLEDAEKKGLFHVVEALSKNALLELDVYGKYDEESKRKLLELCKLHGVEDRVNIHGFVEKSLLLSRYSDYCALLMPSKNETFGMVYVESLLNELPILCCSNSGIDGYLNKKSYIKLCRFGNVEDILILMNDFYSNNHKIKSELISDYKNDELNIFSIENIKRSYKREIENAIEGC